MKLRLLLAGLSVFGVVATAHAHQSNNSQSQPLVTAKSIAVVVQSGKTNNSIVVQGNGGNYITQGGYNNTRLLSWAPTIRSATATRLRRLEN